MATQQCPQCQKIMDGDARFCSSCGTRLPQQAQLSTPAQQSIPIDAQLSQPSNQQKVDDPISPPTPSVSTSSEGLVWRKHLDSWNGFSLERPSGWEVRITNDAIIVCQDIAGLTNAVIRPIQLQQSITADELSRQLVKMRYAINETFKAWQMSPQDITYHEMHQGPTTDQVLLRISYTEQQTPPIPGSVQPRQMGTELLGVLSVMVDGNSAMLSGFQAPPHSIEKLKPIFQRILSSFQTEPRLPRTEYVEQSKHAFTVAIPVGWQVTSKLFDRPNGLEGIQFRASNSAEKMSAESPGLYYDFQDQPKQAQGRNAYPPLHRVLPYRPATAFLEQIIVPDMRQRYPDLQVERIVNRLDRVQVISAQLKQHDKNANLKPPTIASLQCTFTEQGVKYRQRTYVTVSSPAISPLPIWFVIVDNIVRAPFDQFAQHYMILEGITESLRPTQEWMQEQQTRLQRQKQMGDQILQQQRANLQQQIMANQQALLQGQMQRNQIWRDAQQRSFEVQQAAFQRQQGASHQQARAFSNYIADRDYMLDPYSGIRYEVPSGHNHYWANRFGDVVIGTNSPYSPGSDFQLLNPTEG